MRAIVTSTYPDKTAEIKVSNDATLADIQKLAESALKLNLTEYHWSYVNFGEDVIPLKSKSGDYKPAIKENTTFVLSAPLSLLPSRGPKGATPTTEADNFKGFTYENIFAKIAKSQGKQRQFAFEYLDTYTSDILKSSSFTKLSKAHVAAVLARDSLSAQEIDVFDALLRWADEESKRKGEKPSPESRKAVIGDLINLVRFPLLSTEDIAAKVTPQNLLTSVQILDLFTYVAQRDLSLGPTLGSSLSAFSSKPRKGASRYGQPGKRFGDNFTCTALEGDWSWGSGDHVNTSDRVTNSDLENITAYLTGSRMTQWKSGDDDWNLPRGTERCGIYTYPQSSVHAFNLKFSKGQAVLRGFRFFCTRLERAVTLGIFTRKNSSQSWGENLNTTTLPFLSTGQNQKQWVEFQFSKAVQCEEFRVEIRGGQCAFHSLNFINGP